MGRRRVICECGGSLSDPVPRQCPHCGATILSVRQRGWPRIWSFLIVVAMFAVLAAFVYWMATGGS